MKVQRPKKHRKPIEKSRAELLLLCGFFLLGLLLGRLACGLVTEENIDQLRAYLLHYSEIAQNPTDAVASFVSLFRTYYRYPVVIYLLGFTAAGVALIPVVCMAQGFFLSFSIQCFAKAFGRNGVTLALSAMGVRCLFTVPCTLFLAMCAAANALQRLGDNKGLRGQSGQKNINCVMRLLGCFLLLLIGVIIELLLVPRLMCTVLTDFK